MFRARLKSKIYRATVTHADLLSLRAVRQPC
jgi:hypothetical protein